MSPAVVEESLVLRWLDKPVRFYLVSWLPIIVVVIIGYVLAAALGQKIAMKFGTARRRQSWLGEGVASNGTIDGIRITGGTGTQKHESLSNACESNRA